MILAELYTPSKKEFLALSKKYNLIPVYREILADFDTPVSGRGFNVDGVSGPP